MVIGHTNAQGFVEVDTLEALGPGVSLPPLEPSQLEGVEAEDSQSHAGEAEDNAGQPAQLGGLTYAFKGVVESMKGNIWTINGQEVNVQYAENTNQVSVGALVEFEGYYSIGGQFIVTKIEVKQGSLLKGEPLQSSGKGGAGEGSGNGGSEGGGNDQGSGNGEDDGNEEKEE